MTTDNLDSDAAAETVSLAKSAEATIAKLRGEVEMLRDAETYVDCAIDWRLRILELHRREATRSLRAYVAAARLAMADPAWAASLLAVAEYHWRQRRSFEWFLAAATADLGSV